MFTPHRPATMTRPLIGLFAISVLAGCVVTTPPVWRVIDDIGYGLFSRSDLTTTGEVVQVYQTERAAGGNLRLRKVDANGATVWQHDAPASLQGGSFLSESNDDGTVLANLATPEVHYYTTHGELAWSQTLGESGATNDILTAFRGEQAILVSRKDGVLSLHAFDHDGATRWTYTHSALSLTRALGIAFTANAIVVIARDGSSTHAISLDSNGNLLGDEVLPFSTPPSQLTSLTYNDHAVYVAADHQLVKLDATGQPDWQQAFGSDVLCATPGDSDVTCYLRQTYLVSPSRLAWFDENGQIQRQVEVDANWVRDIGKAEGERWVLSEWSHPNPAGNIPLITFNVNHYLHVFDNDGTLRQTLTLRPARWMGQSYCMDWQLCSIGYTLHADINAKLLVNGNRVYAAGVGDFTSERDYQAYISAYDLR